jgi:hypothetical protein
LHSVGMFVLSDNDFENKELRSAFLEQSNGGGSSGNNGGTEGGKETK